MRDSFGQEHIVYADALVSGDYGIRFYLSQSLAAGFKTFEYFKLVDSDAEVD